MLQDFADGHAISEFGRRPVWPGTVPDRDPHTWFSRFHGFAVSTAKSTERPSICQRSPGPHSWLFLGTCHADAKHLPCLVGINPKCRDRVAGPVSAWRRINPVYPRNRNLCRAPCCDRRDRHRGDRRRTGSPFLACNRALPGLHTHMA